MTEERSISNNFSTKKLDDYLAKRYECSLIQVAFMIATVLSEWYSVDGISIYGIKISAALKQLNRIRSDFLNSMIGYFNRFDLWGRFRSLSPERKELFVRTNFEEAFKKFDQMGTELKPLDIDGPGFPKWRPKKKLGIIASMLKMSPEDRLGIIEWFYARLQGATYGGDLYMRGNSGEKTKRLKRMIKRFAARNVRTLVILRHLYFPEERFGKTESFYDSFSIKQIDFRRNMIRICRIPKKNPKELLTEVRFENTRMLVSNSFKAIQPSSEEVKPRLSFPTDEK
ncbi:MAG: hypothetical protein IMZ50_06765 [Candidatus Atribacteria bacterium]|nr:hypothetical protein [Candidatus Atribacteria bacterium]